MTIAAAGHAAAHGAAGAAGQVVPSGKSDTEQQILLLLILAGVIIFIQSERSGKGLNGVQFAALGVVGFFLLVLSQFWAEAALTFTILFVVSIILNSPKGIPLVPGSVGGSSSLASQLQGYPTPASATITPAPYTGTINQQGLGQGTSEAGGGTGAIHP